MDHNFIIQSRLSARSVQLLAWVSLQQKEICFTRLSSSNQQQGEQLSSTKQHAINCKLNTHCIRTNTTPCFPVDRQTTKQTRSTADTGTTAAARTVRLPRLLYCSKEYWGESRPPEATPGRTHATAGSFRGCRPYDLRLAQLKKQTCFFTLICICTSYHII